MLQSVIAEWRKRPYGDLGSQIGKCSHSEVVAPSGVPYQIGIQVFWDGKAGGNVRVLGRIDDAGLSAFFPVPDDFIMAPDGGFVGEHGI